MVNLEVRWLGVIVAPGRKVIVALGRTTVGLDLDTSDLAREKYDAVVVKIMAKVPVVANLARSKESFSGAGVAPQMVVRWFRPWARSGSLCGCTRPSGADPGRQAGCCSNPRGRKRHSLCPCWDPGTLGSSPVPPGDTGRKKERWPRGQFYLSNMILPLIRNMFKLCLRMSE